MEKTAEFDQTLQHNYENILLTLILAWPNKINMHNALNMQLLSVLHILILINTIWEIIILYIDFLLMAIQKVGFTNYKKKCYFKKNVMTFLKCN